MLDPLPSRNGPWQPDWRYEQFLRERFINLGSEWQRMLLWLESNPSRQKLNMKRFVGNWMDKSGVVRASVHKAQPIQQRSDLERGRAWLKSIRAQLKGRQPGEDEHER